MRRPIWAYTFDSKCLRMATPYRVTLWNGPNNIIFLYLIIYIQIMIKTDVKIFAHKIQMYWYFLLQITDQ